MKIGFNMLLWTAMVTREHLPQLKMLKAAGADGVELPVMGGTAADYKPVGAMLDDLGLERTASMCFLDEEHNPISDNPAWRKGGLDWMRQTIENCHAAGVSVLCGPMFQALGWFTGAGPTEAQKEHAAEMLRAVAGEAQAAGVLLAVEPINRFECFMLNTQGDAAAFARQVNHPNVQVLYDTFHANLEEKDPVGCIRKYGDTIGHFHVSANDRGTPGRDHIDWPATFAALRSTGYDRWLVVEAFGRALPELAAATRIWRDMFDSPEQLARESIAFIKEQWAKAVD